MSDPALTNPLLRRLRQDHPDVDIVILPPEVAAPETESDEVAQRAATAIAQSRRTLAHLLAVTGRPDAPTVEVWSTHSRTGSRQRVSRALAADLPESEVATMLEQVGDWLLADGWDARPYADGSSRLRAVRNDLVLEATGWRTSVEVELRSVPFPLSDATAESLEAR